MIELQVAVELLKFQVGLILKILYGIGGVILLDFAWRLIQAANKMKTKQG